MLALPIAAPFFNGKLPMTADAMLHLHRMVSAGLSLNNGVYPRWAPHLHAGFGYPLHNFYTPLWHIIGGALYITFDFDAVDLWLAAQAAGVLLCAPGAYLFTRTFASRPAALVAAAAYTWSPIRFREIWDQGNVSQLIGMALIAWVFWGIARLAKNPSPGRVATAGLLIAALILTHHPTAFYVLPFAGIYTLVAGSLAGENNQDRQRRIAICIAAYALAIVISTIYWLPSLTEVQYTQLDNSISAAFDVRNHFKDLSEILGPTPVLDRTAYNPYRPLNIGIVQVIFAALGFLVALWPQNQLNKWQRGTVITSSIALMGCIFLMTDFSLWIWENVPFAERLSFPWRLLGMTAFLVVPANAIWIDVLSPKWKLSLAISAIVLIVVSMLPAAYPLGGYFPPFEGKVTAADAQRYEEIGVLGITGENEYLPKWTDFENRPAARPDYALYENLDWFFTIWDASIPETATVQQLEKSAHRTGEAFEIQAEAPFSLQIRQMYFPGWKATLDGKETQVKPTGKQGLATVEIPAGSHTLEIWYDGTRNQKISIWVTGVGLLICAGLYIWRYKTPHPKPAGKEGLIYSTLNTGTEVRFSFAIIILSGAWLMVNQAYIIPHTHWFRPENPLTQPAGMQTAVGAQFFQPDIGYRLELIGYTLKQKTVEDDLNLTLYWRALQPFEGSPRLNLSLTNRDQTEVYAQLSTYNLGFSVANWPTDKYIIHAVRLELSENTPPTIGVLRLKIFDDNAIWITNQNTEAIALQALRIEGDGWDKLPASAEKVNAQFGESILLSAVEMEQHTETLELTLYWDILADLNTDYTLFLHFQENSETIAQADQPPLGINYRTSEWRKGDKLISHLTIPRPEAESLLIGLFETETVVRLPLREANIDIKDDGIILELKK